MWDYGGSAYKEEKLFLAASWRQGRIWKRSECENERQKVKRKPAETTQSNNHNRVFFGVLSLAPAISMHGPNSFSSMSVSEACKERIERNTLVDVPVRPQHLGHSCTLSEGRARR